MVEKPPQGTAPSNLNISGRYILQPEIFDLLGNQETGAGNEIQLTDAMMRLMQTQSLLRHALQGPRPMTSGSKLGFLDGQRRLRARARDLGPAFRAEIEALAAQGLAMPAAFRRAALLTEASQGAAMADPQEPAASRPGRDRPSRRRCARCRPSATGLTRAHGRRRQRPRRRLRRRGRA